MLAGAWLKIRAELLVSAIERLGVARTIVDPAAEETIDASHVAAGVQYRALDRAYFR